MLPIGITSSAIELKIFAIAARIKNHKVIIKKKEKKHHKIVLLAKFKLNSIEVFISKALIDSVISYGKFVLINDVQDKCEKLKKEIKNLLS